MKYIVRWLPSASNDLKEIRAYLDKEVPECAKEITGIIYESAESLSFMPTRCRVDDETPEYRWLMVLEKYKIFFRIIESFVEINFIRHTSQDKICR